MTVRRIVVAAMVGLLTAGMSLAVSSASASAKPAKATHAVPVVHYGHPNMPAAGGSQPSTISANWSGYAATSKKKFNYVHATFVQPSITCTGKKFVWTSNWVGIDGFNDGTVEQDGTFAHCAGRGNMTPTYYAWYELYPAGSVNVFPVHPGDVIDASVSYSHGQFSLTVSDESRGEAAGVAASCAHCQRSSAEWIIERPALCTDATFTNCFLTRLADFGTTVMQGVEASVDGGPVRAPSGFTNYPINMIDKARGGGFISLDGVSGLSGRAFAVKWFRQGNLFPITL